MEKETEKYDTSITDERIEIIAQFIIRGATRSQMIRTVKNPVGKFKWDIVDRQIDKYISRAKALIRKNTKKSEQDFTAIALARYDDLYQKNYAADDLKECRAVQDSVNKLIGLNAPDKIDATTKGESLNKGFAYFLMQSSITDNEGGGNEI